MKARAVKVLGVEGVPWLQIAFLKFPGFIVGVAGPFEARAFEGLGVEGVEEEAGVPVRPAVRLRKRLQCRKSVMAPRPETGMARSPAIRGECLRLRALYPSRPNTLGYTGVCDCRGEGDQILARLP